MILGLFQKIAIYKWASYNKFMKVFNIYQKYVLEKHLEKNVAVVDIEQHLSSIWPEIEKKTALDFKNQIV